MNVNRLDENLLIDLRFNGDLSATTTGDLSTVKGLDNLRQALFNRLVTVPGTLAHRPEYGAGIKRWQNKLESFTNKREAALAVQEQFLQDRRVDDVLAVQFTQDELNSGKFTVLVRVRVVGYNNQEIQFDPFETV